MRELGQMESSYETYPGRAPGGSGRTGIGRFDSRGYTDMLNERLRYMRLRAALAGEDEPEVRADPRSNFRTAFGVAEGDVRLPGGRSFSQQGGSLAGTRSALGALRSRQGVY
jgi:hypothetical protein